MRAVPVAFVLLLAAGLFSCAGGSSFDWSKLPTASPAGYTFGTAVVDTSATIDETGGTITGPAGTPVEGVVVTIPAGAVSGPTSFTLGHDEGGIFTNVSAGTPAGLVISLTSSDPRQFAEPLTVVFPTADPTLLAVPFYIDDEGRLDLLPTIPAASTPNGSGFQTWHASAFGWVNTDSSLPPDPVMTGFRPFPDGFDFANSGNDYAGQGRCWGMSHFSRWFFLEHGGALFYQFTDPVLTHAGSSGGLQGQDVIATRAHIAITRADPPVLPGGREKVIQRVKTAIANGVPVLLELGNPAGDLHAVYDPNQPGAASNRKYLPAIDYDTGKGQAKFESASGSAYDSVHDYGNGDLKPPDDYPYIFRDAQAGFNGENLTKIEITSHQNKDTVRSGNIALEGKIHSGQVSIRQFEVTFLKPDGTWSSPQDVDLQAGDEDFSVNLDPLGVGDNTFVFQTRGYGIAGSDLKNIPNDSGTLGGGPFMLTYDPGATSSLAVTGNSTQIMGSLSDPDSRTEINANFSANFAFEDYPTTITAIQNGTFPIDVCTSSTVCQIVQGRTSPSMDPADQGIYNPISVTYDSMGYNRTKNGFELTEKCHGDGALTWVPLLLKIAIEPGCSLQNRQYRLVFKPGCEAVDLCPPTGNQPTLSCQCLDPDTETWHDCSTSAPMTIPVFSSLQQDGNNNLDTVTPPRIAPGNIEDFILNSTTPRTFGSQGSVTDTSSPTYSFTENATVTLTLAP